MKRPSFQFYPGDWQANSNLRRCTHAEKGVWLDVMCLMHDQPEYGVLRWPLKEIAQAVGAKLSDLRGLASKSVLKGSDTALEVAEVYTPRSGRKDGESVPLLAAAAGPVWYSSRMLRDEYVRTIRGESTRFGEGNDAASKPPSKASPKPPFGEDIDAASKPPFGDGASSSSSSSSSEPNGSKPSGKPDRKAKGARRVPDDFVVTPEMEAWIGVNAPHVDWRRETDNFRDWEFQSPRTDWSATWRTWMRKAEEKAAQIQASRQQRGGSGDWTEHAA